MVPIIPMSMAATMMAVTVAVMVPMAVSVPGKGRRRNEQGGRNRCANT
jgi:hypothetical protein